MHRAGADVFLVEARDRVGGRAWRLPVGDGLEFEAGCEVADEAHDALLALAGELGVATRLAEPWGGELAPSLEGADAALFHALHTEIEELAARIDPLHPEELEGAGALDAQTLGGWLTERGASGRLLDAAETWYAVAAASVPIGETSLLHHAAKQAAGAAPNGLRVRFVGGPSALAARMAATLGDRIRLSAEVVAVEQDAFGVRLSLADGRVERAGRAILALPLTVQRGVRFDPELPAHRREALARARYGDAVKAGLAYEEIPAGAYPILDGRGVVHRPEPGLPLLVFFAGSGPARELAALDEAERRRRIAGLAGGEPSAFRSVAWAQKTFTRGSYVIFGPGDLTSWGRRLGEPWGRVHFAGAEASPLPSYMNGAIVAGERAAREVLGAL